MLQGNFDIKHIVNLNSETLLIDGSEVAKSSHSEPFLSELYHSAKIDYPKFFKMDVLCKAGFIASEFLLNTENCSRFNPRSDRSILLFNKNSSFVTDSAFTKTIANKDDFFPKPSLFVYTLPNIVTGEIAIRNKYFGATELVILPEKDYQIMASTIERAFCDKETNSLLTGWIDASANDNYEVELYIIEKR